MTRSTTWTVPCVLLLPWLAATAADHDAAPRPRLQVINGSDQAAEVFWLKDDGAKVLTDTIPPGAQTTIDTTLGHRFVITGQRDGKEVAVTSKQRVQAVRFDFADPAGIPAIYTQRASAGGYPVVASAAVNPYALKEAVYLIDLLLAKRPDVRQAMIESGSRLCIIGWNEYTTDQPEFRWLAADPVAGFPGLPPKDYWDARARGLGGSESDPFCSCGEENVLCYPGDPYSTENILIHEFAHNIHLRGLANVDPTFDPRLKQAYDAAMKAGLWRGKYASVNHHEYFAEGVQSWFDNNRENDHDHNHVDTRAELIEYDRGLADLCREVFGDTELRYTKPQTRLTGHLEGYDPSTAPTFAWPERLTVAKRMIREHAEARNEAATASETPITVSKSHRLASGHWMESRAILSRTGRIDVSTHTWSKSEGAGFHGAVIVFLVDEHQNRLYSTKPRSYGVNSKHLPGDDRTDSFHEPVPADIIAQADGVVIQHLYRPESEVLDRLQDVKEASRYLAGILRDGAEIILLGAIP